jgi:Tol biopolymer transport system component
MFCTVCASDNTRDTAACAVCGAALGSFPATGNPRGGSPARSARLIARRILGLAPLIALIVLAGWLWLRHAAGQARAEAAYAAGDAAWSAGDYQEAVSAFSDAGDHRDASRRAAVANAALDSDRLALDTGLELLAAGDHAGAIDALLPAARRSPGLGGITAQLEEARRLRIDQLVGIADAASASRDPLAAERALRDAAAVDPSDERVQRRLATLLTERGPLLYSREQKMMVSAPDAGDATPILEGYEALLPTWSPDRSAVAFFSIEYSDPAAQIVLSVLDLASGQVERVAGLVSAHAPAVWSPDGRYLAFTSISDYDPITNSGPIGVRLGDLRDGRVIDVTGEAFPLAFNPAFSADGRTLYFVSKEPYSAERPQAASGDLFAVAIDRIERNPVHDNLTNGAVPDVWSAHPAPEGRSLLLYSLFGQSWYEPPRTAIRLFDPASGDLALVAERDVDATLGAPVWSPSGERFAFTDATRSLTIVEGGRSSSVEAAGAISSQITWSPDGQRLIAASALGDLQSTLIAFDGPEPSASELSLRYDADSPYFGPPQWAPVMPPVDAARIGTGLDTGE